MALDWLGDVWNWLWDRLSAPTANAWAAMAGWATAVIALVTVIVAGVYAKRQVDEAKKQLLEAQTARIEQQQHAQTALAEQARLAQETLAHDATEAQKTREEQAQPNVVIFTEPNHTQWQMCELVVKNFGTTPAYNIQVSFDTTPQVSPAAASDAITDLRYPSLIPILAPWQEWRTFWDFAPTRLGTSGLASRHEATVKYRDAQGTEFETSAILDWDTWVGTMRVKVKGINDIADLLDKRLEAQNQLLISIAQQMASYSTEHKGIWVYRSEDDSERTYRAREAQRRAERDADNRA